MLTRGVVVVLAAVSYLAGCGDSGEVNGRAPDAWAARVRHPRSGVRAQAAEALAEGAQRSDHAAELLLAALEDPETADVHDILARGLGPWNTTRAAMVARVIQHATDIHPEVRRSAVTTLGTLPASPAVVAVLARALADRRDSPGTSADGGEHHHGAVLRMCGSCGPGSANGTVVRCRRYRLRCRKRAREAASRRLPGATIVAPGRRGGVTIYVHGITEPRAESFVTDTHYRVVRQQTGVAY